MQQAVSYLQGMSNPFEGVLEAYGQGQGLRENRDILRAKQIEQARKEQAQLDVSNIDWNDHNSVAKIVAQYPEYTKGVKDWYDQMEAKEQQAKLSDMSRYISVLRKKRPELATTELREKARILTEGGNSDEASELLMLAGQIEEDPDAMANALSWNYAVLAGKDNAAAIKDISTTRNEQDKLPSEIAGAQATAFKTNVESNDKILAGIAAAAASLDPQTFSRSIAQWHSAGQITDEQFDELQGMMKGTPEEVLYNLQSLAKQSPEYVEAFKPEINVVNTGATTDIVEYDPQTGQAVTRKQLQNTVSPNQKYSSDTNASIAVTNQEGQNQRANLAAQVSRLNAQDAKDVKLYGIDINAKNAANILEFRRQQADIDSKKGKRVTQKDGRVFIVYPDGTGREAIDKDGKPLIDKGRPNPKIAEQQRAETLRQQKLKPLLDEIDTILDRGRATGSIAGAGIDAAAKLIGANPRGSLDAAKLDALGGQLVMMMPRMEGPQSDKDVDLYKQMAGRVGSRTTTIAARKAAMETIRRLNKKYENINNASQVQTDDLF